MERWPWGMAIVFLLVFVGCTSPYDPDVHPTQLVSTGQADDARAVDLDGNGRDELVRRGQNVEDEGKVHQSVLIQTLTGRAVAQVNFAGRVIGIKFADLTQDGRLELVVPVVQGDSLYYSVVNAEGEKLRRFFVVSGEPRQEPGGTIAWDPRRAHLRVVDVTSHEGRELVSFLATGYARQPRGVWVHTYPEGKSVGHQRIGAMPERTPYFGNVDDDPHNEWLFGSVATNNGAAAAGMRDDRAYLGAMEVKSNPRVQWHRELGGTFSEATLKPGDLDGDGTAEFVALRKPREGRRMASPLLQIDPATGATRQRFRPTAILRELDVATIGPERKDRIVVRDAENTVRILNADFEVLHRRTFESTLQRVRVLPDANGDGQDELFVLTKRGTLWLESDLSVRAFTPQGGRVQLIQVGAEQQLQIGIGAESTMVQFRISEHPWWWIYRYGPVGGIVLLGIGIGTGGILGWQWYHRTQLWETVRRRVAERSDREWMLIHPQGKIRATSAELSRALHLETESTVNRDALRTHCPALDDHLDALVRDPAGPQTTDLTVEGRSFTVTSTPLEVPRGGRPYWLVWLDPAGLSADGDGRAGRLVVKRVVHDLKNPLTSMLLTVQRMQMEYQETVPEAADVLDDYTERIEDRVASLRRMTTNILKVMGQEDLRRVQTDLSSFVDEVADTIARDLPPDIDLSRRLDDDLPAVLVDRDQIHSVLENLVSNALEAMPDGGRTTLTTRLARDLCLNETPPRDYVVIEVLDTGTGMAPATQKRLFEPGFSTRDDTGLGMALVRKIVDDHGGHIEVESERDVGTSVTLYLPVTDEADDSHIT